jgi:hypothetical protein
MKSSMNWQQYQYSGQIPAQSERNEHKLTIGSKLKSIWQTATAHLESSSEPRVWSTQDQTGRVTWSACDPTTRQSISQLNEQEMRVWLEERHYTDSVSLNQGI